MTQTLHYWVLYEYTDVISRKVVRELNVTYRLGITIRYHVMQKIPYIKQLLRYILATVTYKS